MASDPRLAPSILNCTPATPTLSDALAEIVTDPDTVAPAPGEAIETVGAVVSLLVELLTVTVTVDDVVRFPAASRATALRECDPFEALEVFHVIV